MNIIKTDMPDVLVVEPRVFGDERGLFYESFHQNAWSEQAGLDITFVQDNHFMSSRGGLRGLHYQ